MTRVAFLADVHVGNRGGGPRVLGMTARCREAIGTLVSACRLARLEADVLVVLGDLFDDTRPKPQMITAVQAALNLGPDEVILATGNHDADSTEPGDHALGPLPATSWTHGSCEYPEHGIAVFDGHVHPINKVHPGLAIGGHFGIVTDDAPPYLMADPLAVRLDELRAHCEAHSIPAVFAGHWHRRRCHSTDPPIWQVGALCPTGWSDDGLTGYGSVLIWDGSKVEVHEVPGPRFLKITGVGELVEQDILAKHAHLADPLRVRWEVPPNAMDDAIEHAQRVPFHVEVVPAAQDRGAELAGAADAAARADTVADAVAAYVAEMPLPDGVDRAAVLAGAQRYLAGGAQ